MKLDLAGLATLYPHGVLSDLTIYPTKYYKSTGYVVYTAQTIDPFEEPFVTRTTILNPSPPG